MTMTLNYALNALFNECRALFPGHNEMKEACIFDVQENVSL